MKLFFLILLIANAAAYGYIRFDESRVGADSQIALLQIGPDKIKLLKSGVRASESKGAATRPSPALVCLEWGGFSAEEAARAAAALATLTLGDKVSQRETSDSYWVYIPPLKTKAEADKKAADVKAQFLWESILISLMGAIVGIVAGILFGNIVAILLKTGFVIPWLWVIAGVLVCTLVGLLAGLYPAYKAAKLDPIVALRYE